jgi:nucleoside-diphosphate-sugar epimerase
MDVRCRYSSLLRVAITGGSGFIGSRLERAFGESYFESKAIESIDDGCVVIHLSADVSPTRDAFLSNIATDTWLLELVNERHLGLIYASGNNVYPHAINCRVYDSCRFNDYYAASKIVGESLVTEWAKVPFAVVRIADVFGVGQRHGNLFKAIERSVRARAPLELHGRGLKRRTYIHVDELCNLLKFLATESRLSTCPQSCINVGYHDSATVLEILDWVSSLTGLEISIRAINAEDESCLDVRTMSPTVLPGYTPIFDSFKASLSHYLDEIAPR